MEQLDLPEGWEAKHADDGMVYYVDHITGKTSSINPRAFGQHSHLPEGWGAAQTEDGKIFYWDVREHKISLVNPNIGTKLISEEEDTICMARDQRDHMNNDISESETNKIWTPLKSEFNIRILRLLPGVDTPIECVLEVASLDADNCHYQALSYTWGARDQMQNITCNGIKFAITRNLYSALLRLRKKEEVVSLWVDALCINQSRNPEAIRERESQVKLMWKIFSQAKVVIANLGEGVENQSEFEKLLEPFRKLPEDMGVDEMILLKTREDYSLPGIDHPCWPATSEILSRDYFQRVWVIQECVLAAKLEFLLGDVRYHGDFVDIVIKARMFAYFLSTNFAADLDFASVGPTNLYASNWSSLLPDTLVEYAYAIQNLREVWWSHSDPQGKITRQRQVHEQLLDCASHKATDIRDRVYSLLGLMLVDGHPVIKIDYSDSLENLARRITIYLVGSGLGPELLYKCIGCQSEGLSWTINIWHFSEDWFNMQVGFNYDFQYFKACGSTIFHIEPMKGGSCLLTDAVILDTVAMRSPVNQNLNQAIESSDQNPELIIRWIRILSNWIETLKPDFFPDGGFDEMDVWRTATADVDYNRNRYEGDTDISPLLQAMETIVNLTDVVLGPLLQLSPAARMTQVVDMVNQGLRGSLDGHQLIDLVDQSQIELPDLPQETFLSCLPFLAHIAIVSSGRCLGTTATGMIALLPGNVQVGDHLAIVLGAPIPIVLRETGDGFRVVGSCYIHYMMDGQALESHLWKPRSITLY